VTRDELGRTAEPRGGLGRTAAQRPAPEAAVEVPRPLAQLAALGWRGLVIVAVGWLIVAALVRLRIVVLPVIIALLLTTLLAPAAEWLRRRGAPRLLAAWVVLIGSLAVLIGVVSLLAPQVGAEMDELGRRLQQGFEQVLTWLVEGPLDLTREQINRYVERAFEAARSNSGVITSGVLTGAVKAAEVIAGIILTLVLVFFFLKDGDVFASWIERQAAPDHRHHMRAIGQRSWSALSSYVRGTAVIALVDAVLIGIALLVIGVPLVVPLVVLTFFAGFFPLVGAVTAGAFAALVALVSGGPLDALFVAGAVTLIQQVEGDVLQPVVLGRAVRLHPVVILLALTSGAVLAGIAGAFLAVPLTAVATSVGSYLRGTRPQNSGTGSAGPQGGEGTGSAGPQGGEGTGSARLQDKRTEGPRTES
jgi:predicted PurR-regulated permease PerM